MVITYEVTQGDVQMMRELGQPYGGMDGDRFGIYMGIQVPTPYPHALGLKSEHKKTLAERLATAYLDRPG